MQEEPVTCRGINGSISISKDGMSIIVGLSSAQAYEIRFGDISAVVVERKSVVPFMTLMILAVIVFMVARYNLFWFVISINNWERFITPVTSAVAILCAIVTLLQLVFVTVTVRSRREPLTVRLVPSRSAKRLARRFSELCGGS